MKPKTLNLYLPEHTCDQMNDGRHPFFSLIQEAFAERGFKVKLTADSDRARLHSVWNNEYSMFYMKNPFHVNALYLRHAYVGPFWKIEKSQYRRDFRITGKLYDPNSKSLRDRSWFFDTWYRLQNLPDAPRYRESDYVFIPLQGKLTSKRTGQSMSPIDMIKTVLECDTNRKIIVKLHPGEAYSPDELAALDMMLKNPRLELSDFDTNGLLARCAYVVTQNSSVAFHGLFYRKPAILFADCEFHHIFQRVTCSADAAPAFARVLKSFPDYEKYVYWFLQENCINASRSWAKDMIIDHCRELGWNISDPPTD